MAHVPRKISVPLPSDTSSPCATGRYPGTRVNAATATRFPTMTADGMTQFNCRQNRSHGTPETAVPTASPMNTFSRKEGGSSSLIRVFR